MIKVLSWNTAHWQRKQHHDAMWGYLAWALGPDIALLQEVRPFTSQNFIGQAPTITSLDKSGTYTWEECSPHWGTGVFTAGHPIRSISIPTKHVGCLSCAEVLIEGQNYIIISLYAQLEDGRSIKVIHRLISDLTIVLDKYRKTGNVILAGDFNAGLEWDKRQRNNSHRLMFERIKDFGLVDVLEGSGPVQTWRNDRSKIAWQIDYMFISKKLVSRIGSVKVLCTPEIEIYSDHNPIELVLK